jgi:tetratricopeptide (TPR) repeat protein
MNELLAELARDPERRRRRVAAGAVAALALVAVGAGTQRAFERPAAFCRKAGEQLGSVWELPGSGPTPHRDAIQAAFAGSGLPSATETWRRVSVGLDAYAREWVDARTESCEATHVRGEASPEVLDLRTTCLTGAFQRLRALTDVFRKADRGVVGEAVSAVNALPELARCADLRTLRALTPLPRDPATRAKVDELDRRIAEVGALRDAGKLDLALPLARAVVKDARAVGHDPTSARALELQCWLEDKGGHVDVARPLCEESLWAAEAARDDEVAATVAIQLVAETASSKARREDAERWARLAAAILKRMGPGHAKLEGWLANNEAEIAFQMGEPARARADYERAIALKTAAEGPDHPDVGFSVNNYGNTLADLGDYEGALVQERRALAIFERAYGPRNRMMAMPLSNEGEILNALGRHAEALPVFQRAVEIMEAEMEPSSSWLAYPLTGQAQSLLATGRPADAVAPLERAVTIRDRSEIYPMPRGETRFALARALWESGGDRARARALAVSARAEYERADGAKKQIATIDAWLRASGGGASAPAKRGAP